MKHSPLISKRSQNFLFLRGIGKSSSLSIIISCLALGVSVFAAVVNYNSANNILRPLLHIEVGDCQSNTPCFGLFVRNNGMGPARIKSVDIYFDGEQIKKLSEVPWIISRRGFPGKPLEFEVLASQMKNGMVIGAGQEILLFAAAKNKIPNLGEFKSVLERVQARIVYSSISENNYEVNF